MKTGFILACVLGQAAAPWLWAQASKPPEKALIEGQVVNAATGEPVKKARLGLLAAQARADTVPYGATSDAAGHFIIQGIEPGKYRLMAERTGFVRGDYGARGANRSGTTLSLDAGQTMKDVVIRLMPQGVISGRVVDEDGDPVADVNVSVMRYAYVRGKRQIMPAGGKPTNDLGEYRVHGLAPGRYFVCATYRPMAAMAGSRASTAVSVSGAGQAQESYAPTYYPNTTDPASAAPLDVAAGTQLRGIDLVLAKSQTVRVSGRIVNLGGENTRHSVMVNLTPRDSASAAMLNRASTSVRDASGNFELRGVTPGSYVLTAVLMEGNRRYAAKLPVDVGSANVEGLSVSLSPGASLTGRVRIEEADTKLNYGTMRVILQPREQGSSISPGGSASVKADGSFAIDNLGPDRYTLSVFGMPETCYVKSVRFGDEDVTNSGPDVSHGAAPLDIVVSAAGGQIDGAVHTQKDEPAAGVAVVLIPGGDRRELIPLYKTATTDPNGNFSLKGIAPGDYKLYAWDDVESGAYLDPEFLKPFENQGESVSIKESSHESVQLKLLAARPE